MVQVRSCRSFGNSEEGADLCVLISLDVVQHDDRPLPFAERMQCARQARTQLTRFCWIPMWRRQGLRQFVRVANFAPTGDIQRRIRHDAMQPRTERLLRAKPLEGAKCMQKSFLHRILGIIVRQHDGTGNSIRAALMTLHQTGECCVIPCLCREHQLPLLERLGRHWSVSPHDGGGSWKGEGDGSHRQSRGHSTYASPTGGVEGVGGNPESPRFAASACIACRTMPMCSSSGTSRAAAP